MVKGTEELACTIKECYPMIVFFICVVCGLCGNKASCGSIYLLLIVLYWYHFLYTL